jgi:DUF1365 family protein
MVNSHPSYWAMGNLWHARTSPVRHAFEYPIFQLWANLQGIEKASRGSLWFGLNRFAPIALNESEYLDRSAGDLRLRTLEWLQKQGAVVSDQATVELLSFPKFFGYSFNPVSFYFVTDTHKRFWIAEVSNTFGQRHPYWTELPPSTEKDLWQLEVNLPKEFYVSPFNPVEGSYTIKLRKDRTQVRIQFLVHQPSGEVFFDAGYSLQFKPFNFIHLLLNFLKAPLALWGTTVRILGHAAVLFLKKKMTFLDLPQSQHPLTYQKTPPLFLQRVLTGEWLIRLQDLFLKKS